MEYEFWFADDSIRVVVFNVSFYGSNRPATRWEPAESAEIDSYDAEVTFFDDNGDEYLKLDGQQALDFILHEDLCTEIDNRIWKELESSHEDY